MPGALDDRPHAQPERRVPEEHEQRATTIAIVTTAVARSSRLTNTWPNGLYDGRAVGHDALRLERRADVEEQLHDLGDRDEQTERRHEPGHRWAVRRYRNSTRSSDEPEHAPRTRARTAPRRGIGQVVTRPGLVVHRAGRERLRTERQVEDARGLVRQHQPDGEQRVDAAEGEARKTALRISSNALRSRARGWLTVGRSTSSSPVLGRRLVRGCDELRRVGLEADPRLPGLSPDRDELPVLHLGEVRALERTRDSGCVTGSSCDFVQSIGTMNPLSL